MLSLLKRIICAFLIPIKAVLSRFCPRKVSTSPKIDENHRYQNEPSHVVDFDWQTDWDVKSKTKTECKIEQYRNNRIAKKSESELPEKSGGGDPDFFADMAPTTVRQAKVFVGTNPSSLEYNRLSVSYDEQGQFDPVSCKDFSVKSNISVKMRFNQQRYIS